MLLNNVCSWEGGGEVYFWRTFCVTFIEKGSFIALFHIRHASNLKNGTPWGVQPTTSEFACPSLSYRQRVQCELIPRTLHEFALHPPFELFRRPGDKNKSLDQQPTDQRP